MGVLARQLKKKPDGNISPDSIRPDGTQKQKGWLGVLKGKNPDGKTFEATEYSTQSNAIKVDNKRVDFPTLVPTLTKEEIKKMLDDIIPHKKPIPESIMQKAITHARSRIEAGQSPFASNNESPK